MFYLFLFFYVIIMSRKNWGKHMEKDIFSKLRLDGKNLALKTIQNKIEQFISSGIYTDLEDFISDNPDLTTFQNHTKLNNTLRRVWGYQITDQEYLEILEYMRKEVAERKQIALDKLDTVNTNGKEITTYETANGTMVLDNSYSGKPMGSQLEELQAEHKQFQVGGANNTDAMMSYMQQEVKPEIGFNNLSSISKDNLTQQENKNLFAATQYQANVQNPIQVDLQNGLIMQDGNIHTIEERENGLGVYSTESISEEPKEEQAENTLEKPKVHTLKMFQQAGFSDALILAFIVGMFLGFLFLSTYAKAILP